MATRVELPAGQWAELYEPTQLPEGRRRRLKIAQMRMGSIPSFREAIRSGRFEDVAGIDAKAAIEFVDPADMEQVMSLSMEIEDTAILAYVRAWSAGPTVDAVTLLELPGEVYDALKDHVGALTKGGSAHELDTAPNPDPASPIEPSIV
ncbi:hypothetical protein [Nocardia sp. NPDC046763]|uniref:hypothetical protein n=1 Tax=Nocardia sp. NPDC046763 TaxID=3155256 RepID=UPI0033D76A55